MRIHHLFRTSALAVLAMFSVAAQTGLLSHGSFESWNTDKPESWSSARGENQALPVDQFSESFTIDPYQTPKLIESANAWINRRFPTNRTSNQPFGLSVFNGEAWESLTETRLISTVLKEDTMTFVSIEAYQFGLAFEDAKNTRLISEGLLGGRMTTIRGISFFHIRTDLAGLVELQFYSNDNGFAISDVSIAEKS